MRYRSQLSELLKYVENRSYGTVMVSGLDNYAEQRIKHEYDVDYSVVRAMHNRLKGVDSLEGLRCVIFPEHYKKALSRLLVEIGDAKDTLIEQRDMFVATKRKGIVPPSESKSSRLVITEYNARIRKLKDLYTAVEYYLTLSY